MTPISPQAGLRWIQRGFRCYAKRPIALSMLLLAYLLVADLVASIPDAGPVTSRLFGMVTTPFIAMTFLTACACIERTDKPRISNIALLKEAVHTAFFPGILTIGLLYVLATMLAVGISALVDGGTFVSLMTGQITATEQTMRQPNVGWAMICAAVVFIPCMMALSFAAPLMAWKNMRLGKALFFSFFGVRHALRAFVTFVFGWITIGLLANVAVSVLGYVLPAEARALAIYSVLFVISVIMHCCLLPAYQHLYADEDPATPSSSIT